MSRIGKKPIAIPKGVTVKVAPDAVEVQGPKGKLRQALPPGIVFAQEDGTLVAKLQREDPELGKFHGLARSLVANAVAGVAEGFKKELDIVGIGYRAEVKGKQVHFALGYSHPVVFEIPNGNRHRDREADAHHGDWRRPPAGGPGGREHPPASQTRSVQAEGRAVHGRGAEEEGREDGGLEPTRITNEDQDQRGSPRPDQAPTPKAHSGNGAAAAAHGVPQRCPHLRAGRRRHDRPHDCLGIERRAVGEGNVREAGQRRQRRRCAGGREDDRTAAQWTKGSSGSCSIATGSSITGVSKRLPTPRAKPAWSFSGP